ncbi:MAG: HAD-IIB family hydrolase [Candidatus Vogelbacteria bacterium]|nr:HAD-IIB family hydrolase [Candidatus Vogelbacteria bacterium]
MKKLIIFDLDGTLAESKSKMDPEMSRLVCELLMKKDVAVISGGAYKQFQNQFLESLSCPQDKLVRLHLFPTCSTTYYKFSEGAWECVYKEFLSEGERAKITSALNVALPLGGYVKPDKIFGDLIEDRETQISFSALGQLAPGELKKVWDPNHSKRLKIKKFLDSLLPNFEIRIGGATTIDITRKGIDKAHGIRQMEKLLGFSKNEMLFIGDAIFPGGNDYPVKEIGIDCIAVGGPQQTKVEIRRIISEK